MSTSKLRDFKVEPIKPHGLKEKYLKYKRKSSTKQQHWINYFFMPNF